MLPQSSHDHAEECVVPAGEYPLSPLLGGNHLTDGFSMDRFCVTNARFGQFVEAGGYDDFDLWSDEGWAWRLESHATAPRWWHTDHAHWKQFQSPDRPVIGICWHEAQAFCEFNNRRLPTEAEWEVAARGSEGFLYPWGDRWEDGRVRIRGMGPRLTWPIGEHPGARGPFGHEELIGNVWQWTSDPWPEGHEGQSFAVRGAAWSARPEHCRSDHRNAYPSHDRWSHVGFRTVAR